MPLLMLQYGSLILFARTDVLWMEFMKENMNIMNIGS